MQKVYKSIICVHDNLDDFTDFCGGIRHTSAKVMTKLFVKQKLRYRERVRFVPHTFFPIQWNGGRRDELWRSQQSTFHNSRSGQWQVMHCEVSHFTFWKDFRTTEEK